MREGSSMLSEAKRQAATSSVTEDLAAGLPCGRRTPKGRNRWYLLSMPPGREASICRELKRLVPSHLLADAFVLRKERWMKRQGAWFIEPVAMYRGYGFAISPDAPQLATAISKLTLPVELVGTKTRSWAPLSDDASAWFTSAADAQRIIRSSTAIIVNGALHVTDGPLVGQEASISKVDRHRRCCTVTIGKPDESFTEILPMDVPYKS